MLFPFYDNAGANITFFRISMDTETYDNSPGPDFNIQLHMHYLTPNPAVTQCNSPAAACSSFNRFIPFTFDDYLLLNTDTHNRQFNTGWAFAYADLFGPGLPQRGAKLLWDRFFSDTVYVDTALGTAAGWGNYAQFADALESVGPEVIVDLNASGTCETSVDIHNDDPSYWVTVRGFPPLAGYNDVCILEQDDDTATLGNVAAGQEYWGAIFPDVFYVHYFTEWKRPAAGQPFMDPTLYSIAVITSDVTGQVHMFPPPAGGGNGEWQWDAEVYNANERPFSTDPGILFCHAVMDVHQITNNVTSQFQIPEGFVNIWGVNDFGGPGTNCNAGEDAVIVQLENWTGLGNLAWGLYPAHERTTIDQQTQRAAFADFVAWPVGSIGVTDGRVSDWDLD
jgi:hypothetical protein